MGEVYTYNATHITLIRDGTVELTQSADLGTVGTGRVVIDDTAGTLAIVGQKDFSHTESSCANTRTFVGFIADREYGRDAGEERAPHVGAARGIAVGVEDLNSTLGFRPIYQETGLTAAEGGNRPAETLAARAAWLMATSAVSGLFVDNGRCDFPATIGMDKADYRYRTPGDVLADMATAARGYNYHVQDYGSGPELIFRDDNASTADTSTLRISNVSTDVDSDQDTLGATRTFFPSKDAVLSRSPSRVISLLAYSYAQGTIVRTRAATATTYNGIRGGTASNSDVKSAATAALQADAQLWQLSTEQDVITVTITVPASAVNLLYAGWRVSAKFSHLATEGYGSFSYFRVLERTVVPKNAEASFYDLRLKLSPQEAAAPAGAIVQSNFGRGGSGAGWTLTLPNPVGIDGGGGTRVLVALIGTRDDADATAPASDGGAWTRLNGTSETAAHHGSGAKSGMTAYWKVTDNADRTFGFQAMSAAAVWELNGVDMTTATLATKDNQTTSAAPEVMDIGSLGSPAAGELVLMGHVVVTKSDTTGFADYNSSGILAADPSAGWTQQFWNGVDDFSYGVWPATYYPLVSFCDGEGDGSAVTGKISRTSGLSSPPGGTSAPTAWAGIAIKVPAA